MGFAEDLSDKGVGEWGDVLCFSDYLVAYVYVVLAKFDIDSRQKDRVSHGSLVLRFPRSGVVVTSMDATQLNNAVHVSTWSLQIWCRM